MFQQYERDYLVPVKLKSGHTIYLLEESDAEAVKRADKAGKPLPPPQNHRLLPFGEGIKIEATERIECFYRDSHIGTYRTLKEALDQWDYAERWERFCIEQDREQAEIDARYYSELSYDQDGYKIYKPRPRD